jgi:hypothetical protein
MSLSRVRAVLTCGAALLAAVGASAQAPKADAADPAASVPAATHRSAFADYRRLADPPPADWKGANQTVERIGGWRAYAREANTPAPAASAASAPDTMRIPRPPAPAHRH